MITAILPLFVMVDFMTVFKTNFLQNYSSYFEADWYGTIGVTISIACLTTVLLLPFCAVCDCKIVK